MRNAISVTRIVTTASLQEPQPGITDNLTGMLTHDNANLETGFSWGGRAKVSKGGHDILRILFYSAVFKLWYAKTTYRMATKLIACTTCKAILII